jgi:hypothetical protein
MVFGPTHALIGEAGPEVVIPLTRPCRAKQLVEESGLMGIIGDVQEQGGGGQGGPVMNNHFTINEVGDGNATAHRVVNRLALAAGVI